MVIFSVASVESEDILPLLPSFKGFQRIWIALGAKTRIRISFMLGKSVMS